MLTVILKLIGACITLLGIILIYDARILTKRFFGFGDQNEATLRIENIGFYSSYCRGINCVFCIKLLDNKSLNMLLYTLSS